MSKSTQILSDIIHHMKYAKYLPEKQRRETYEETVDRNKKMHLNKYPELKEEIEEAYKYVYDKKVLPSMRSLQFAGKPIELNNSRLYNCSAIAIDHVKSFSELIFLLLSGTGVGISVQQHHVEKLPQLQGPLPLASNRHRPRRFLINDSIEGWAEAIKVLIESYFLGKKPVFFDYRDIRPKGALLITAGGKAPGPQPLRDCIHNISKVLNTAIEERGRGTKLTTLEAHDIACYIADAVLAGGIRRAAIISLFSFGDEEMLHAKTGKWYEANPQRGRANNSVVLVRSKIRKKDFFNIWEIVKNSGSGEPGIFFTNDKDVLTNPCAEISLKSTQMCNLTEINGLNIEGQEDFNNRARVATFLGTLQAGYTDFHYLRESWQTVVEKDALLGVSITGIASGNLSNLSLTEATEEVIKENKRVAKLIGINPSSRLTCIKPSGTSSLILGCSSGIHSWHNDHYIRRVRVGKNESIYTYLQIYHPKLIEDDFFNPKDQAVISIPVKAPEGAITRKESVFDLLKRVKKYNEEWIEGGHIKGANRHNVSVTVSVKDDEWDDVGNWMWDNRKSYNGISVLPYLDHTYPQAPFEDCTKEEYEKLYKHLKEIDLTKVVEMQDNTNLRGELACTGGACEVK